MIVQACKYFLRVVHREPFTAYFSSKSQRGEAKEEVAGEDHRLRRQGFSS